MLLVAGQRGHGAPAATALEQQRDDEPGLEQHHRAADEHQIAVALPESGLFEVHDCIDWNGCWCNAPTL